MRGRLDAQAAMLAFVDLKERVPRPVPPHHQDHGRWGVGAPVAGESAGVRLVGVDGGLQPPLAIGSGDALSIEGLGDVEDAPAQEGCGGPRRRRAGSAPAWAASWPRLGRRPSGNRRW